MEATLALAEKQLAAQYRAMGLIVLEPREYTSAEAREMVFGESRDG